MPLIDAKTLAAELQLSPKKVRQLAATEKIPAFKFGSKYRFDLQAVLESARYKDLIAADARRSAQQVRLGQPRRPFVRSPMLPKKKGNS